MCFIGESGTRPDWWHARLHGDERSLLPKEAAPSIVNLNCNEDLTGEILPANDFECSAVALYLLDVSESNGEMRARFGVDSRLISPAEERGASPTATTINLNLERGGEGIRGEGGGD